MASLSEASEVLQRRMRSIHQREDPTKAGFQVTIDQTRLLLSGMDISWDDMEGFMGERLLTYGTALETGETDLASALRGLIIYCTATGHVLRDLQQKEGH